MHLKSANSMATSELVSRNDLVGTGRAISVLFGLNAVDTSDLTFKACFSATAD